MVRNVIATRVDRTVKSAASLMSQFDIGCLVVLEDDNIVGMVTERDILKRVVAVALDPEKTMVEEIMSKPPIIVGSTIPLEDAVKLMFEHKIKKLPVVEPVLERRKLVGLVTLTDIARIQPKLIETLKELFAQTSDTPPKSMKKVINYYIV